jgi:Zn-dependent peptidase ImmA (M78 family)
MLCLFFSHIRYMPLNTTAKGDLLEEQVFKIISDLLKKGEFFVSSHKSKIYQKKAYYSADRGGNIIFDLSIETYRGNSEQYSLLTLIEVKNYSSAVPVNDIEEFESKITQIGKHNTKGVFMTNSVLQQSALNLARKYGIAIARVSDAGSLDWLAERKNESMWHYDKSFTDAYLTDTIDSPDRFVALADGRACHSLNDLLLQLNIVDNFPLPKDSAFVPYLSEDAIDQRINQMNLLKCFTGLRLDADRFCEWMSSLYDVAFDFDHPLGAVGNMVVLGRLHAEPLTIQINSELKPDIHRWRFTLVHEMAHLILHYSLLRFYHYTLQDTNDHFNINVMQTSSVIKRMELQANMMAGQILLPKNIFLYQVAQYFKEQRINTGFLYIDYQPQNQRLLFQLLEQLSSTFQVSMEVAKLRLRKLHLLKGKYDQSIGSILKEQGKIKIETI